MVSKKCKIRKKYSKKCDEKSLKPLKNHSMIKIVQYKRGGKNENIFWKYFY